MTSLRSSAVALVGSASLVAALTACGSDAQPSADTASTTPSSSRGLEYFPAETTTGPAAPAACPTSPPANPKVEWTERGATGSVEVSGSTDTAAPYVKVQAPFSVTDTQVHTLTPGNGPVVSKTATVSVCYLGVNGRDGSVFDSSYERGEPVDFPLDGVVAGFQKAIAGQKVGSTVAVAVTSADGYPDGQPAAGIQKGDTLVFAIKILSATA